MAIPTQAVRKPLVAKGTLRTLTELAFTHVATFAFPLAFAVLCGRVLGVANFGVVSFYTALAAFLGVIIEFGFDWLGIREVAQAQGNPRRRDLALFNITAAKLLLCAATVVVVGAALLWLRGPSQLGLMLATGVHLVGFALDPGWFLRGMELNRLLLLITVVTRVLGIGVLWLAVSQPQHMAAAMWSYAFVTFSTSAAGWVSIARLKLSGPMRLQWQVIGTLMRRSSAIVFGNLNAALLTNGGVAMLGLTADPAMVGAANLALRVKMAGQAVLLPIKQLTYVRLSALAHAQPDEAVRFGRVAMAAMLTGGVGIAVAIALSAERIVHHVFLGDQPVAVCLIMLLGLSVPLNAMAELFGMQCLIAFGHERSYAVVVGIAAVVFTVLMLCVLHGSLAYGWALLLAEGSLAAMAGWRLREVLRNKP